MPPSQPGLVLYWWRLQKKGLVTRITGSRVGQGRVYVQLGKVDKVDFGAWWSYVYDRLAGFELREEAAKKGRAAWTFGSKERKDFAEFYAEEASAGQGAPLPLKGRKARPAVRACTG